LFVAHSDQPPTAEEPVISTAVANVQRDRGAAPDIIVIGASAGGVETLRRLVPLLPPDLPVSIFVVLHVLPHTRSYLPEILSRNGFKVCHAADGSPIERGRIYIAPPNHHLLIEAGHMHLSSGPRENRHRPAVNPLFRSAALAYGPRVIGVILSGNLDDGTAGLWEIKRRSGIAIVQDPEEALHPGMPQSAISNVDVDYVVKLDELPSLLVTLTGQAAKGAGTVSAEMPSKPTDLTCPECRGPLGEYQVGRLREFRCRVGHVYAPAALLAAHSETVERTLWAGVVALEEGAELARRLQGLLPAESERLRREEQAQQEMAERLRGVVNELTGRFQIGEGNQ
jgi:two-component system chemotaxis response regulator CheB